MGLLDVINGMRNGPGGQSSSSPSSSGGMSPITMAILALLAYKGIKHLGGSPQQPAPSGGNVTNTSASAGGLGDVLGGLLRGFSRESRNLDLRFDLLKLPVADAFLRQSDSGAVESDPCALFSNAVSQRSGAQLEGTDNGQPESERGSVE